MFENLKELLTLITRNNESDTVCLLYDSAMKELDDLELLITASIKFQEQAYKRIPD